MNKEQAFSCYQRICPTGTIDDGVVTSSSRLIIEEALNLGMEVNQIPSTPIFKLTHKGVTKTFYYQNPGTNSATAMYITRDKRLTRNALIDAGISVPKGYTIKSTDDHKYLKHIYDSLKKPLVVKPSSGTQGKAITIGVESVFEYVYAIRKAFNYSKRKNSTAIVEELLDGFNEYRVLVTQEKVLGVIKRIPANVIGDGTSNIRKLVKMKNSDPRRGEAKDHPPLFKIEMDDDVKEILLKQGLDWKYIPEKDEQVFLRKVSNISMGGDSIDYTDKIHPSVKDICIKAMKAIPGLKLGGVDFMTKDISKKQTKDSYGIIEINNSPGLDIHDYPYEGKNRKVGVEFLRLLFGEL